MMRDSWALKGRPQYTLARGLLPKKKKKKDLIMNMRKEEPKGDEYIVGPYLRQRS